jgi:hypothetical protein
MEINTIILIGGEIIGFVGTLLGTYFTAPTEKSVLKNFYTTTRPLGFWKPFKIFLSEAGLADVKREHKNDLIALPFVFMWQVSLFLLPMQLMIKSYTIFMYTLIPFVLGCIGLYILV